MDIDGLGVGTQYSCFGPAVRVNNGDFYYLWHRDGEIQIWKRIGGNYSMVSEGGTSIVPGPLKARLEVVGTTLTAYVNGVAQTSGTATELATGQPGIISSDGGSATVDNFRCGDMPYTSSGPPAPKTGTAAVAYSSTVAAVGKLAPKGTWRSPLTRQRSQRPVSDRRRSSRAPLLSPGAPTVAAVGARPTTPLDSFSDSFERTGPALGAPWTNLISARWASVHAARHRGWPRRGTG